MYVSGILRPASPLGQGTVSWVTAQQRLITLRLAPGRQAIRERIWPGKSMRFTLYRTLASFVLK